MKNILLLLVMNVTGVLLLTAQQGLPGAMERKAITALINQYSAAREKSDTVLLKKILLPEVDQLVSSGEWRMGISAAVEGMLRSSANNAGSRALQVEKIRMLQRSVAVVDCKYEIQQAGGNPRKMWSTFIVVAGKQGWKISAIRNMLPAG